MAVSSLQLDVESLRTFLAVLDNGGMTKAARVLNLSQSAVSWKIKRLEERVGKALLIRDGHTLRPTRDGRELLDDARQLVAIHDRAAHRLERSELSGLVRLGAIGEVSATRVAAILGRFKRLHPATSIEFIADNTHTLSRMVENGELDVAIIQVGDEHLRDDDVVLWVEDLCWAVCCETLFDEGQVPLITFGGDCFYRPLSEPILEAAGVDFNVAFSVPSTAGVYSAISAGLGVGVIGAHHLGGEIVEWPRGAELDPLPHIHQIARTVPGEHPAVAAALLAAIVSELHCPDDVSRFIGAS